MLRCEFFISLVLLAAVHIATWAVETGRRLAYPPEMPGAEVQTYKQVGDVELKMYIYKPKDWKPRDQRGAIVFFFGGGWQSGSPAQFRTQCEYLASRGMVAMAADYRVASRHNVKVADCVADAKSAIRWARKNADKLGIDPNKIAAAGGSAGGHLAACTAVIPSGDDPSEDQSISSQANAAVLFNPVLILGKADIKEQLPISATEAASLMERFRERIGADPKTVSPYHHIRPGLPPIIIFHGTADTTVPFATVKLFAEAMTKAGNQCGLVPFENAGHGFFNYGRGDNTAYKETLRQTDQFLTELGYLTGKPTL
ncbi:MAG: alpha/beta hydrolase, partial [Thermogutta sp.]